MVELTKSNARVYRVFRMTKPSTKKEMARVLKEQLDNLQMLFDMMQKDIEKDKVQDTVMTEKSFGSH